MNKEAENLKNEEPAKSKLDIKKEKLERLKTEIAQLEKRDRKADKKYSDHMKIRLGVIAMEWIERNGWNKKAYEGMMKSRSHKEDKDEFLTAWNDFIIKNLPVDVPTMATPEVPNYSCSQCGKKLTENEIKYIEEDKPIICYPCKKNGNQVDN